MNRSTSVPQQATPTNEPGNPIAEEKLRGLLAPAPGAVYQEQIDVPLVGPQTVELTVVDAVAPRLLTVDAAIPLLNPRFVLALRAIDDRNLAGAPGHRIIGRPAGAAGAGKR